MFLVSAALKKNIKVQDVEKPALRNRGVPRKASGAQLARALCDI